jgi:hypothetical protein
MTSELEEVVLSVLMYYTIIHLEDLRKMNNFHNSAYTARDSISSPPNYEQDVI